MSMWRSSKSSNALTFLQSGLDKLHIVILFKNVNVKKNRQRQQKNLLNGRECIPDNLHHSFDYI